MNNGQMSVVTGSNRGRIVKKQQKIFAQMAIMQPTIWKIITRKHAQSVLLVEAKLTRFIAEIYLVPGAGIEPARP